ncbi:hypothetical protein NPIL_482871 [Nephila pilipes]|uniref:Uncharacterized protein n=1 Tax=Nephila pilipes TaxID=299642 RepID=A0A8X6UKW2_NEPPI|nr:hypothetical protein NPIL_482871 [Nephila pilipes]
MESFIDIIVTKNKTGEGISEIILSKLDANGLDIMNRKRQAYSIAATVDGRQTSMQHCENRWGNLGLAPVDRNPSMPQGIKAQGCTPFH